jgi:hypothetical protein
MCNALALRRPPAHHHQLYNDMAGFFPHHQQQYNNGYNNGFFGGWAPPQGAAGGAAAGFGAQALPRFQDQQQGGLYKPVGGDALMRDVLRAQLSSGNNAWAAQHAAQSQFYSGLEAHLLSAAGSPQHRGMFPLHSTIEPAPEKDSGPSRALLASLLGSCESQQQPRRLSNAPCALSGLGAGNHHHHGNHHAPHNYGNAYQPLHHAQPHSHHSSAQHPQPHPHPHQQQQRSRGSSASIALNKEIMGSASLEQLLAIVRGHGHTFDFFNISTAVSRVPKLLDTSHICAAAAAAPPPMALTPLHHHNSDVGSDTAASSSITTNATENAPDTFAAVAAASSTSSGGSNGCGGGNGVACHLSPVAKELADKLCDLVLKHLNEFDGRGLANTAWAFAKLRYVAGGD